VFDSKERGGKERKTIVFVLKRMGRVGKLTIFFVFPLSLILPASLTWNATGLESDYEITLPFSFILFFKKLNVYAQRIF
jgi:hypothetical protein